MTERRRNLLGLLETRLATLGPERDDEARMVATRRALLHERIDALRAELGEQAPPRQQAMVPVADLPPRRDLD